MKILHLTPHMGGGIGTVVMDWMDKAIAANDHYHRIVCLDYANDKAKKWAEKKGFPLAENMGRYPLLWKHEISEVDIVLTHFWDHPMLADLFADSIPDCRMVCWCHKNITATMFNPVWWDRVLNYPDRFINTSPIQGCGCEHIWSTGNMDRFLAIEPKPHQGFNVGTVASKKLHPEFMGMCLAIKQSIPDARFTILGESSLVTPYEKIFTFTGKVDDVVPYLAEMDVFGYPLRSDHYGTAEQALGECMSAGVVPIVMNNPSEALIVRDGENGKVASTEQEYIEAVQYIYGNPAKRKMLSNMARTDAKRLYSIDEMVRQWDSVFNSLMEQPKKRKIPL